MKIVYIAHPISGDVEGNVIRVKKILKKILSEGNREVFPIAPYLTTLELLDDDSQGDRRLGMELNEQYFQRGMVDELWVCGAITRGVAMEIGWASENFIEVKTVMFDV